MFSSLTVIKAIEDSYFLSFGETYGYKKRSTAVLQPLLTLKSNTMKNTLQMYVLWFK